MSAPLRAVMLSATIACSVHAAGPSPLTVMVSIPPQVEIVERIGGESVTVETLIPPGRSPVTYEPSPRQLTLVAKADLLVPVGVPFERQVVDRIGGIAPGLALCEAPHQEDSRTSPPPNTHTREGHHHEDGKDPHFWLDPIQTMQYAQIVCECLCAASPDRCGIFRARLEIYHQELDAINKKIGRLLAPMAGQTMVVFHPAYGHFAARYGLSQLAIEREGKEPSVRHLAEVINEIKALGTKAIFVQPQFASSSVFAVAEETGAGIVELDPLAPDLSENLERIAATVAEALGQPDVGR